MSSASDQASSDAEHLRADEEQAASDRDQKASDRDMAGGRVDLATHARSRDIRRATSHQRRLATQIRRRTADHCAAVSHARRAARAAIEPTLDHATLRASSSDGGEPLSGDAQLKAVTDAIVELHLRYYHRAPTLARTQLLGGDLLACTLEGVYTDVEKTMIELAHQFIEVVERLCGREVASYVSNLHVGPDMAVEMFVLERDVRGVRRSS